MMCSRAVSHEIKLHQDNFIENKKAPLNNQTG